MWLRGVFALCTLFLSSLEHRCVGSSDCAGGALAFLLSSLEHRCTGSSDCGGVLEYIEPMYRGPSRGPCIGTIYPTLLGFGGIQAIILSYNQSSQDMPFACIENVDHNTLLNTNLQSSSVLYKMVKGIGFTKMLILLTSSQEQSVALSPNLFPNPIFLREKTARESALCMENRQF